MNACQIKGRIEGVRQLLNVCINKQVEIDQMLKKKCNEEKEEEEE